MIKENFVSILSLFTTLTSVILGFILQRDIKKVRELERKNQKLKSNLVKAITAIQGYQILEEEYAKIQNIDVSAYRRQMRKNKNDFFDSDFLTPSNINRLLENNND